MSSTGEITGLADGDSLNAVLSGLFAVYYKDATLSRDGSDILFNAIVRDDNLFDPAAATSNSTAGAGCCGTPVTTWTRRLSWGR